MLKSWIDREGNQTEGSSSFDDKAVLLRELYRRIYRSESPPCMKIQKSNQRTTIDNTPLVVVDLVQYMPRRIAVVQLRVQTFRWVRFSVSARRWLKYLEKERLIEMAQCNATLSGGDWESFWYWSRCVWQIFRKKLLCCAIKSRVHYRSIGRSGNGKSSSIYLVWKKNINQSRASVNPKNTIYAHKIGNKWSCPHLWSPRSR